MIGWGQEVCDLLKAFRQVHPTLGPCFFGFVGIDLVRGVQRIGGNIFYLPVRIRMAKRLFEMLSYVSKVLDLNYRLVLYLWDPACLICVYSG